MSQPPNTNILLKGVRRARLQLVRAIESYLQAEGDTIG